MIFENPHTEYTMEVSGTFLSVIATVFFTSLGKNIIGFTNTKKLVITTEAFGLQRF